MKIDRAGLPFVLGALFPAAALVALRRPGLIIGTFLAGYGVARFLVEYVREPDAHLGTLLGIATMGQLLSLPLAAGAPCFVANVKYLSCRSAI